MAVSDFDRICAWPGFRRLVDLTWRLFRVNLALVAPEGERSLAYYSDQRQGPFCRALHEQEAGRRLCAECDQRFYHQALELAQPLRYRCHAGLTEFIVPVIRQGQVIALLQCGQVFDAKPSFFAWPARQGGERLQGLDLSEIERSYYHNRILPPHRQDDLMLFLQVVADYLGQTETPWLGEPADRNQDVIRRVMNFIEANLSEPQSVEAIARAGGVSSRTLARLFRRETGMTVLDFVLQRRIARACHHLTTSDLSCIEIAFAVGFQSVQNFNRTFRKLKEATPREWRQAAAQEMRRPGTTPKEEHLLERGADNRAMDRLPIGRDGPSSH